eukprot:355923-Rhodomonas_salina.1
MRHDLRSESKRSATRAGSTSRRAGQRRTRIALPLLAPSLSLLVWGFNVDPGPHLSIPHSIATSGEYGAAA